MLSKEQTEMIIEAFLREKGIVNHQISTFDNFIENGIHKIILDEPEICIEQPGIKYTVKFSDVYIPRPTLLEDNRILRINNFYPNEARNRDLTYDSPVYVNITEKTELDNKEPHIVKHPRIVIARIPIMLMSEKCHLKHMNVEERISAGECDYDVGGYFIVRGKERVLVSQIRCVYNVPLVYYQKSDDKYKIICEVRSMSEITNHSVLIQALLSSNERTLYFSIPYIQEPIKVGIVFKALGFTSENDIRDILLNNIAENDDCIKHYIKFIIRDSYFIETREDAIKWIGNYVIHNIKDEDKKAYVSQILDTELFPHLGMFASNVEKAHFLGYMLRKLLFTASGKRKEDDRDHFMNKRIDSAGILCYDLFKQLFKCMTNKIKILLEKKKQHYDILSTITKLNIITIGFRSCFSTSNWTAKKTNSYIRTGVSQILSRLSYSGFISHLRRINIQIEKNSKNTKIRQINPSQLMFIDFTETPEGHSVGIVLNMALTTLLSDKRQTVLIREIIEKIKYIISIDKLESIKMMNIPFITIFLNGVIIGICKISDRDAFITDFKFLRRHGFIDNDISISIDDLDNILIFCDDGRLIRPVLTVNENKLKMCQDDDIDKLLNKDCDWNTLVEKNYIEYVDSYEIDKSVIAFSSSELEKYENDYCEISPTLMFGVATGQTVFPDHNQAPRVVYQASMMKQAMGIYATSYQNRTDTAVHVLEYPQKPFVSTHIGRSLGCNEMPSGVNAIVAIACYSGQNQEDSIILNKASVERGLFRSNTYHTYVQEEKKTGTYDIERICVPPLDKRRKDANYTMLDSNGIIKKGMFVDKGDVIIGKIFENSDKNGEKEITDCSLVIKHGQSGIVDRIFTSITPNGYKLVKVVIRTLRIPEVGDKFASRSSQKGTTGALMNVEDMPFTSEGIVPDIVINSHCIPSRMTIAQLLECVLGKYCAISGHEYADATPFSENSTDIAEKICDRLGNIGFERHGYEIMYSGITGEQLRANIFIGPTYYQRLKHLVAEKIHARAKGPVASITRQPLSGRSVDGGLRCGEMEVDALISHGVVKFLRERLYDCSDKYSVNICKMCGNISTTPKYCKACNTEKIVNVAIPYVTKLLFQELQAMGIKIKINPTE